MALNRCFNDTPGSTPVVILEKLGEPGQPRTYWSHAALAWGPSPPVQNTPIPDPDITSQWLFQEPTTVTSAWGDCVLRMTVIDAASPMRDTILYQEIIQLIAGDDGSLGIPSVMLPFPISVNGVPVPGSQLMFYNARLIPPPVAAKP